MCIWQARNAVNNLKLLTPCPDETQVAIEQCRGKCRVFVCTSNNTSYLRKISATVFSIVGNYRGSITRPQLSSHAWISVTSAGEQYSSEILTLTQTIFGLCGHIRMQWQLSCTLKLWVFSPPLYTLFWPKVTKAPGTSWYYRRRIWWEIFPRRKRL